MAQQANKVEIGGCSPCRKKQNTTREGSCRDVPIGNKDEIIVWRVVYAGEEVGDLGGSAGMRFGWWAIAGGGDLMLLESRPAARKLSKIPGRLEERLQQQPNNCRMAGTEEKQQYAAVLGSSDEENNRWDEVRLVGDCRRRRSNAIGEQAGSWEAVQDSWRKGYNSSLTNAGWLEQVGNSNTLLS